MWSEPENRCEIWTFLSATSTEIPAGTVVPATRVGFCQAGQRGIFVLPSKPRWPQASLSVCPASPPWVFHLWLNHKHSIFLGLKLSSYKDWHKIPGGLAGFGFSSPFSSSFSSPELQGVSEHQRVPRFWDPGLWGCFSLGHEVGTLWMAAAG